MHSQQTFATALDTTRRNVILLITDGVATRPCSAGFSPADPNAGCPNAAFAQAAAQAAQVAANNAGTYIRPMFYNPFATQGELDYINSIGNDNLVNIDPLDIQAAIDEAVYTEGFLCERSPSEQPSMIPSPYPTQGKKKHLLFCAYFHNKFISC